MSKAVTLKVDPDIGPIGPRKREVEPLPRRYIEVCLPLSLPHVAILTLPWRITEREWGVLLTGLTAMKSGLVLAEPAPSEAAS